MSGIYYGLIIFPLTFLVTLVFIFQSSVTEIEGYQFITNCPLPIYQGNVTDVDIQGLNVVYNVTYSGINNQTGSMFQCSFVNGNPPLFGVSEVVKEYGYTLFDFIPIGWLGYIADTLTAVAQKIQAQLTVIWLFVNVPAEVTNLSFFTYIQIVLLALMGFGGYMAIRTGAG